MLSIINVYLMKRIYQYLLACMFFLQPVVAGERDASFDIRLQNGLNMRVEICTDVIFRVRVSPHNTFGESLMERYNLIKKDWETINASPKENGKQFEVKTENYRLKVDKQRGVLSVSDQKGKTLIEKAWFHTSTDPLCRELYAVINEHYKDLNVASNSGIIGDDQNPATSKDTIETGDYRNTSILSFALREGERFYGGGSTSRDHIQHRGELLRMWMTYQHTEIPMPFLISSNNWGVYYNTTDEADFYLMFGSSMPDIINHFTLITSRPYILPKWTYGLCIGSNMLENQFDRHPARCHRVPAGGCSVRSLLDRTAMDGETLRLLDQEEKLQALLRRSLLGLGTLPEEGVALASHRSPARNGVSRQTVAL